MSKSFPLTAIGCFCCCLTTTASAQNSSLLHRPAGTGPPAGIRAPAGIWAPAVAGQISPGSSARGPRVPMQMAAAQTNQMPPTGPIAQTNYQDRPNISLNDASWTYQAAIPLRSFHLNDVVTIRVDEITRMMAEGSAEARKRTLYEAILTDWIRIQDFRLRPDPQGNGDPSVSTESNSNYRAESTVESRESMTFNIAATVVDIRPNGNLLLEAKKTIRVNDNLWETSLSGLCRAQDIGPDNVVLSKDVIDLEIHKEDRGHLRDGYKRGWFQRWFDRLQPF
jgi:flagellar L-ring protein precursor FlgH